jgi:hypothetical protein
MWGQPPSAVRRAQHDRILPARTSAYNSASIAVITKYSGELSCLFQDE